MTLDWLAQHKTADGRPLTAVLGPATEQPSAGTFRCEIINSPEIEELPGSWRKGIHGPCAYGIASMLAHNRMRASDSSWAGSRFFDGYPGVYFHDEKDASRAQWYGAYAPIFRNGLVTRFHVELYAACEHTHSRNRQRICSPEFVRLKALVFQTVPFHMVPPGSRVLEGWYPAYESPLFPPDPMPAQPSTTEVERIALAYAHLAEHPDRPLPDDLLRTAHNPREWLKTMTEAGSGTSNPAMPIIRACRKLIWEQTKQWLARPEDTAARQCCTTTIIGHLSPPPPAPTHHGPLLVLVQEDMVKITMDFAAIAIGGVTRTCDEVRSEAARMSSTKRR
jgi:hypothetical protein